MTQARGSFSMSFSRYEEVPAQFAQKLLMQQMQIEKKNNKKFTKYGKYWICRIFIYRHIYFNAS